MAKTRKKPVKLPLAPPVPRVELIDGNTEVWLMLDDGNTNASDLMLWNGSDDVEDNVATALEIGRILKIPVYGMSTEPIRLDTP